MQWSSGQFKDTLSACIWNGICTFTLDMTWHGKSSSNVKADGWSVCKDHRAGAKKNRQYLKENGTVGIVEAFFFIKEPNGSKFQHNNILGIPKKYPWSKKNKGYFFSYVLSRNPNRAPRIKISSSTAISRRGSIVKEDEMSS